MRSGPGSDSRRCRASAYREDHSRDGPFPRARRAQSPDLPWADCLHTHGSPARGCFLPPARRCCRAEATSAPMQCFVYSSCAHRFFFIIPYLLSFVYSTVRRCSNPPASIRACGISRLFGRSVLEPTGFHFFSDGLTMNERSEPIPIGSGSDFFFVFKRKRELSIKRTVSQS